MKKLKQASKAERRDEGRVSVEGNSNRSDSLKCTTVEEQTVSQGGVLGTGRPHTLERVVQQERHR